MGSSVRVWARATPPMALSGWTWKGRGEGCWFKLGWRLQGQDLGVPWGQIPHGPPWRSQGPSQGAPVLGGLALQVTWEG